MTSFLDSPIISSDMKSIHDSLGDTSRLKQTSLYITGASGMLASYFIYFLIYLNEAYSYGIDIYACARDKQKTADKFGVFMNKGYFHFVCGDVNDGVTVQDRADYVVHAASPASPQYNGRMPVETILPNVVGTYHLLEYAKKSQAKGFLFFSTANVYGSLNVPASEDKSGVLDFLNTGNSYSEAKRCGEALCRAYFCEYGVPAKSARIFHSYGPTMDIYTDKRSYAEFVRNIIEHEDIVLMSDGSARKGFCYITDTISALYKILLDGKNGESYNVGNMHEFVSILELAETAASLSRDVPLKVIRKVREDSGYKNSPERMDLPADMSKLEALGWSPSVSIEEGFRRVIDYIEHKQVS